MDNFSKLYADLTLIKYVEEHLVEELRNVLKLPWAQFSDDKDRKQDLSDTSELNVPSSTIDIPDEIDDILSKADQLLSQIKLSDPSNSKLEKNKTNKDSIPKNTNNDIKNLKKKESKNILKPIDSKGSEKKTYLVYMNAPYKTEPIKKTSNRIGSTPSSNKASDQAETIKIAKGTKESDEPKINGRMNLNKNKEAEFNKPSIKKNIPNKNSCSFSKIVPMLDLPHSIVNLSNENEKYNELISNGLKEKQIKISKKHSFMNKLELVCTESDQNSILLDNNSLIRMKNIYYKTNKLVEKIFNELNDLLDKNNIQIMIPLFKSKVFAKKCSDLKNYLDELFNCELCKIDMQTMDESLTDAKLKLIDSEIEMIPRLDSIGYMKKEDLIKYFNLKIKIFESKYKIYYTKFLIDNYVKKIDFTMLNDNNEYILSFFNSLISLILGKPTAIVK